MVKLVMVKESGPARPAAEFKAGDVVKLRGSPLTMTIEAVGDRFAACVWAQGPKVYREKLALHTLVRASS